LIIGVDIWEWQPGAFYSRYIKVLLFAGVPVVSAIQARELNETQPATANIHNTYTGMNLLMPMLACIEKVWLPCWGCH
jgi:hypothetical protein